MPVPGFQEFMLPFLRLTADGKEHSIPEAVVTLADQFKISPADREAMQPSGTQTTLYNRLAWAITHLSKSLLIERPSRGRFKISTRGKDVLKTNPPLINTRFLM